MFYKILASFSLALIIATNIESTPLEEIGEAFSFEQPAQRVERQSSGGLCLAEHNAARKSNGKPPLAYDTKLETAAKNHNRVMTSKNCFNHQCSGEPTPSERVTNAGYAWRATAENIAAGQKDCQDVMKGWMNSSGHKKNILGNYKHVGCAMQQCSSCQYKQYWTCNFGTPK